MANTYQLGAEMQSFVRQCALFPPADDSLSAQRAAYAALCQHFTPPLPAGVLFEDHALALAGRQIPLRLFRPVAAMPADGWPAVLYLHGGGWMLGGLDSHAFIAAALALECAAAVLVVDYRLAPEHVFPAAFEDCMAVWDSVRANGSALGINPARVVVAGDSAGGNLAAALCLAARGQAGPPLCGQVLIYPALAIGLDLPSAQEHAEAPLLSRADMAYYLAQYAPDSALHADLRLAPLAAASLADLPPVWRTCRQPLLRWPSMTRCVTTACAMQPGCAQTVLPPCAIWGVGCCMAACASGRRAGKPPAWSAHWLPPLAACWRARHESAGARALRHFPGLAATLAQAAPDQQGQVSSCPVTTPAEESSHE